MQITIRKATVDDAYILAEILSKSWMSAYKDIIEIEELKKRSDIERRYKRFKIILANPSGEIYIAFDQNTPCGQFMFSNSRDKSLPNCCEIVSIYTIEDYWDKGIGRQMMSFALNAMADLNYNKVLLWTFRDNVRARKFYEKLGFIWDGAEKPSQFGKNAIQVRYIRDIVKPL